MQHNSQQASNGLDKEELQDSSFAGEEELLSLRNAVWTLRVDDLRSVAEIERPHAGINALIAESPEHNFFVHIVFAAFADVTKQER